MGDLILAALIAVLLLVYFWMLSGLAWGRDITIVTARELYKGFLDLGLDARIAGKTIEVRGSPIARVRPKMYWDDYEGFYYHCYYDIPDHRLANVPKGVRLWIREGVSVPNSGIDPCVYWGGNKLASEIVNRLNKDLQERYSTDFTTAYRLSSLTHLTIIAESDRWCWVFETVGKDAPDEFTWQCYETVARFLLDAPVLADPPDLHGAGSAIYSETCDTPRGFALHMVEPSHTLILLEQRSWLWRFYLNKAGQKRCLERIARLQTFLPDVMNDLVRNGILQSTDDLTSIYVIGSFPWVQDPADIDLFLIVEGDFNRITFTSKELREREIQLPQMEIGPSVEIVGYETLQRANLGYSVPHARRLRLRHTVLYGSVLLAGLDIFEATSITPHALDALREELVDDRKRADWPELDGDRAEIKAKRKWRRTEVNTLRKFRTLLPN